MNENKIYVDVNATFTKDGMLLPKSFVWEDGVEYEISKVKDIRRAASLKAGGAGMRYTCVVDGKEVYLFYEDNNMWSSLWASLPVWPILHFYLYISRNTNANSRSANTAI